MCETIVQNRLNRFISVLAIAIVLTIALAFFTGSVRAQERLVNQKLEATGNVNLRKTPPSAPFYQFDDVITIVKKGEIVRVTGSETVKTLFNSYEWLQVEIDRAEGGATETIKGWVYNGETGKNLYFVKPQ